MKKLLLLVLSLPAIASLSAQQIVTVTAAGDAFSPSDIVVNQGDIVRFSVGPSHTVLQVSQATWDAGGITPLPGGFSFPTGDGDYTADVPGLYYFVCTIHVGLGMKGTLTVNAITGINEIKGRETRLFPVPAGNKLTYQAGSTAPVDEIRVFDLAGKTLVLLKNPDISDDQRVNIDISKLDKGIYFISVRSKEVNAVGKFIK